MSFILSEFSQIANIEPKLTTYWHKRGEELSSVSTISHKVKVLPQCFSVNYVSENTNGNLLLTNLCQWLFYNSLSVISSWFSTFSLQTCFYHFIITCSCSTLRNTTLNYPHLVPVFLGNRFTCKCYPWGFMVSGGTRKTTRVCLLGRPQ